MRRRQMVSDIQQVLINAGYQVDKAEIDSAFPSKRGQFPRTLYGVWYYSNARTILAALHKRGVWPRDIRKEIPEAIRWPKGMLSEKPSHACPNCGYVDPLWQQASSCPSCDSEVMVH